MSQITTGMDGRTPPTSAEFELPPEPPKWPKVVGIISIVWGSLGLVCGICGGAGVAMQMGGMVPMPPGPDGQQIVMPDVMKPTVLQLGGMVFGLFVAALLIAAGVVLVSRKPAARMLHLVYAVVSVTSTVVFTGVAIMQLLAQMEWVRQNPDHPFAKFASPQFGIMGVAIGALLGLAWPIFCLVWFLGVKKRAEEIAEGVEGV